MALTDWSPVRRRSRSRGEDVIHPGPGRGFPRARGSADFHEALTDWSPDRQAEVVDHFGHPRGALHSRLIPVQ